MPPREPPPSPLLMPLQQHHFSMVTDPTRNYQRFCPPLQSLITQNQSQNARLDSLSPLLNSANADDYADISQTILDPVGFNLDSNSKSRSRSRGISFHA